jgi:hypothetical protein
MLMTDWRRWTGIIELLALGRSPRDAEDPRAYKLLCLRLITACKERAGSGEASERAFSEGLEATVRPWMSRKVLVRADNEILGHLLGRCQRIERELGVRASAWAVLRCAAPLILAPISSVLLVFVWTFCGHWLPLDGLRPRWYMLWLSLKKSSELEELSVLGVILILLSIYSLSRTARS